MHAWKTHTSDVAIPDAPRIGAKDPVIHGSDSGELQSPGLGATLQVADVEMGAGASDRLLQRLRVMRCDQQQRTAGWDGIGRPNTVACRMAWGMARTSSSDVLLSDSPQSGPNSSCMSVRVSARDTERGPPSR